MRKTLLFVLVLMTAAAVSFADFEVTHTFETGTPASANQVNENFDEVETAINDIADLGINAATAAANGKILVSDGTSWVASATDSIAYRDVSIVQPYLAVNFIIALEGLYPSRDGMEPFIGEIIMFGGTFAPRGWAFCNGQLLSISSFTALFSILGTTYGGDGRTTFGLPDLRGRVPINSGGNSAGPGLPPYQLGQRSGSNTTTVLR